MLNPAWGNFYFCYRECGYPPEYAVPMAEWAYENWCNEIQELRIEAFPKLHALLNGAY